MKNIPEFTKYIRVDTVIECLSVSPETVQALLAAMPDAYGGEAPGEDSWPEPDAKRDEPFKLAKVWADLASAVQADIENAWRKRSG